jgi:hypothetical protein
MRDELRALAEQSLPGEDWPGRIARARQRRRQRWVLTAATVAAVVAVPVVVLASPGSTTRSHLVTAPTASSLPSPVPPDQACPAMPSVHLSEDQPPVTDAFICGEESQPVPGDGIWLVRYVKRVTGGLDAVLAAYKKPDFQRGSDPGLEVCDMVLIISPDLYLHSSAGVVAVRPPTDACHHPQGDARRALSALTTETVWTQNDRRIQTQQSTDTHCVDAYKDVIEMYAEGSGPPHRSSTTPTPLQGQLTVCRYTVVKDDQGDRIGHLDGAGQLDAAVFDNALAKVRVDDTCSTTDHTSFALVRASRGPSIVVALDGCAVFEDQVGYFRGTNELRRLLQ